MEDRVQRALGRAFGHGLRPFQERAIRAVLAGESALVIVATGSGKSLAG